MHNELNRGEFKLFLKWPYLRCSSCLEKSRLNSSDIKIVFGIKLAITITMFRDSICPETGLIYSILDSGTLGILFFANEH